MSSMNYAKYSLRRKDFVFKTSSRTASTRSRVSSHDAGPRHQAEHECFDAGHVATSTRCSTWTCSGRRCRSPVMGVTGGIRRRPRKRHPDVGPDPRRAEAEPVADDRHLRGPVELLGAPGHRGNVAAGVEEHLYLPTATMARSKRRPDRQKPARCRRRRRAGDRRRGARLLGITARDAAAA